MFTVDFSYSPWYLLACVALAGGLTWWMYHKPKIALRPWLYHTLRTLRFVALLLLLILFLEPLWTAIFEDRRPPIVAVLVDDSQSLTANNDSAFIRRDYPKALAAFLEKLKDAGVEAQPYRFGKESQTLGGPDSLTFSRAASNPGAALREAGERYANQNLAAVVMLSDGISTEGPNPVNLVETLPVPIFTGLLGDTTARRDVILESVVNNEISYKNTETPVALTVRGKNTGDQTVNVGLNQGGKTLASQPVTLNRANNYTAEVTFHIKLTNTGLQQFEAAVQEVANEANVQNNRRLFFINVLENRIKVALFAGAPHPDIAALHRAFAADERFEYVPFIRKSEGEFYKDPNSRPLRDFDLVILHNFPSTPADKPILNRIFAEVDQRRLPLLHFVGSGTKLSIEPRLAEYMALEQVRPSNTVSEAFLYTMPAYREHSSYRVEDETGFNQWLETAPPLLRSDAEWRPRGGAQVFGKAKIRGIALEYPIMAVLDKDGRKNLTFVGEGIWHYRMHAFQEKQSFDFFDSWIHNLAQWLTVREDNRRFRVYPIKPIFTGDERVHFKGSAYDESYNPLEGAEIKLTVTDPQNRAYDYYLHEAAPGAYGAELVNLAGGTYKYVAKGVKNGREIGTDQGEFSVGNSALEFVNLQADATLMRQLALRTGGTARTARELDALADDILRQPTLKPIVNQKRDTAPLNRFLLPLLIALALLSTEWVLRKRNGFL